LDSVEARVVKLNVNDYPAIIEAYLEVASRGWSISTQITEASRTRSLLPLLSKYGLDPEKIYGALSSKGDAPYSIRTKFVRLKKLADFCRDAGLYSGTNPFETYITYTAPNRFKMANVYRPRTVMLGYDAAKELISSFNGAVRGTALCLLQNGLRISELYKLEQSADGNWFVQGKGGKVRHVLVPPPAELATKGELVRELAKIELTPHQLRKLTATKLASSGLAAHELQQVMGWSSIVTAQSYLQRASVAELKTKMKGIL